MGAPYRELNVVEEGIRRAKRQVYVHCIGEWVDFEKILELKQMPQPLTPEVIDAEWYNITELQKAQKTWKALTDGASKA